MKNFYTHRFALFLVVALFFLSCVNNKKIIYEYSERVYSADALGKEPRDDWFEEGVTKKKIKIDITDFEYNWRMDTVGTLGLRRKYYNKIGGIIEKLKLVRIDTVEFFKRMGYPNVVRESEQVISLFYYVYPPCIETKDKNNNKTCYSLMILFSYSKEDKIVTGPILLDC